MKLEWGLIGSLELDHSPNGKMWQLLRSWDKYKNRGVEFRGIPQHPQLVGGWEEVDLGNSQDAWKLELPDFDTEAIPSFRSFETLERELAQFRKPPSVLPPQLAERLDRSVLQFARIVADLAKSGRAIGFICPSSVQWLGDKQVLLSDAGFVWNNSGAVAGMPAWLAAGDVEPPYRYQYFWDLQPPEINRKLLQVGTAKDLIEHDQRVLARIIAWLLLGADQPTHTGDLPGITLPKDDSAPDVQRTRLFKLLARVINKREPVAPDEFCVQLQACPPSRFFEPLPPPPPVDWWPLVRRTAIVLVLLGILSAGWVFREKIWPPPPPPLLLCPTCPGTSLLREPADQLAAMWKDVATPTAEQLVQELEQLELAHQAQRSPAIARQEDDCLKILWQRFDERLGLVAANVIQELTGNPPNSDEACRRLKGVREIAQRVDSLQSTANAEVVPTVPNEETAEWRQKINFLSRSYGCP